LQALGSEFLIQYTSVSKNCFRISNYLWIRSYRFAPHLYGHV